MTGSDNWAAAAAESNETDFQQELLLKLDDVSRSLIDHVDGSLERFGGKLDASLDKLEQAMEYVVDRPPRLAVPAKNARSSLASTRASFSHALERHALERELQTVGCMPNSTPVHEEEGSENLVPACRRKQKSLTAPASKLLSPRLEEVRSPVSYTPDPPSPKVMSEEGRASLSIVPVDEGSAADVLNIHRSGRRHSTQSSELGQDQRRRMGGMLPGLLEQNSPPEDLGPATRSPLNSEDNPSRVSRRSRMSFSQRRTSPRSSTDENNRSEVTSPDDMCRRISASANPAGRNSVVELDTALQASIQKMARNSQLTQMSEDSEDSLLLHRMQKKCAWIVDTWAFEIVSCVAILSNCITIGWQVEYSAESALRTGTSGSPGYFFVINQTYALIFFVELVFRMAAEGRGFFYQSKNIHWNYFDLFIVLSSLLEFALAIIMMSEGGEAASTSGGSGLRIIRIARISRVVRIIRVVKVVRFVRALRNLVYSIFCTLKALMWSMLLLVIIMYTFSILFTDAVIGELNDTGSLDPILIQRFGSLHEAVHTLFRSIAGGLDWDEVMLPLSEVSWLLGYLFTAYIAFCTFAVLNVMTGVFVQSAMESASRDHELLSQSIIIDRQRHVDAITRLFNKIDITSSGSITLLEFEANLNDDAVKAFLAELDLEVMDAWSLFKLLDSDGHGCVEISDFVDGCLKLKGPAKSVDVACILHENKKVKKKLREMEESEQRTEGMLVDIWESFFKARAGQGEEENTSARPGEENASSITSSCCVEPPDSPPPADNHEQQNAQPDEESVFIDRGRHSSQLSENSQVKTARNAAKPPLNIGALSLPGALADGLAPIP